MTYRLQIWPGVVDDYADDDDELFWSLSQLQIDMPRVGLAASQNLTSGFVLMIATTTRHHLI